MTAPDGSADPRLANYRKILESVEHGDLSAGIAEQPGPSGRDRPTQPRDDIALLGESIMSLASSLSIRFAQEKQFAEVSREIVQGLYLDEVLHHIYESFRSLIPYDRIGCALLDADGTRAQSRWARSDGRSALLTGSYSASLAGSSLQSIIHTGRPRIINDLAQYSQEHPTSGSTKLMLAEGIRSNLTCPLIALGRPVGFLFFSSTKVGTYSQEHQDVFLRLADMVSIIVEKSLLYEEMSRLNRDLLLAREQLQRQATHDGLTGLLNHAAIIDHLMQRTAAPEDRNAENGPLPSVGGSGDLAVLMLDIDYFKSVNDTFGHQIGDQVLQSVSELLTAELDGQGQIGRYGGEEFLVIADLSPQVESVELAERLRVTVEEHPIDTDAGQIPITVSVGVAVTNRGDHQSCDSLIRRADQALYRAKSAGRNRVVSAGANPS